MTRRQRLPGFAQPAVASLSTKSNHGAQPQPFTKLKDKYTKENRPTSRRLQDRQDGLTAEDMRSLLDRRKRGDELTIREIDELLESHREAKSGQEQESGCRVKQATGEVKTVEGTVVQRYGTLDIHKKDQDVVRVMSHNINTLSIWKANNVKVEKLKHVLRA